METRRTDSFQKNAVLFAGDEALNAIYHELCEPTTIERRVNLSCPVHCVIFFCSFDISVARILSRTTPLSLMRPRAQTSSGNTQAIFPRRTHYGTSGCSGISNCHALPVFPFGCACPIGLFAVSAVGAGFLLAKNSFVSGEPSLPKSGWFASAA